MLRVELESNFLRPGQENGLVATSDSPLSVEILCFVQPPRPPQLSGCPECGRFNIESGVRFSFNANQRLFQNASGYLKLTVSNLQGEKWQRNIDVDGRTLTA